MPHAVGCQLHTVQTIPDLVQGSFNKIIIDDEEFKHIFHQCIPGTISVASCCVHVQRIAACKRQNNVENFQFILTLTITPSREPRHIISPLLHQLTRCWTETVLHQ